MGASIGIALALAMLMATASPAEAAKRPSKPTCAKKGSKTVARSRDARVFTAPAKDGEGNSGKGLYGCLTINGVKRKLAVSGDEDLYSSSSFDHVRLAAHYVAWSQSSTDVSCKADCPPGYVPTRYTVRRYDLRRRRLRSLPADAPSAVAVTQRGGVAWLSADRLWAADRDGTRVLDTGMIAASSLAAEISIVSWVRGGVERFARLR